MSTKPRRKRFQCIITFGFEKSILICRLICTRQPSESGPPSCYDHMSETIFVITSREQESVKRARTAVEIQTCQKDIEDLYRKSLSQEMDQKSFKKEV